MKSQINQQRDRDEHEDWLSRGGLPARPYPQTFSNADVIKTIALLVVVFVALLFAVKSFGFWWTSSGCLGAMALAYIIWLCWPRRPRARKE